MLPLVLSLPTKKKDRQRARVVCIDVDCFLFVCRVFVRVIFGPLKITVVA